MPDTQYIEANGITIAYETFGEPSAPPMLLVAGLAVQMLVWPDDLCEQLAEHNLFVIRADNRDSGLSTHLTDGKTLRTSDILRRRGPYAVADMAADTGGLIDALGVGPVHLVGASMGGFIAQTVALQRPELIRTLTLIMTSTGSRKVGRPRPDVAWRMARGRVAGDRNGVIDAAIETFRLIGSPGYQLDIDMIRDIAGRSFDREYDVAGRRRQLAAAYAQPNRTKSLSTIKVPTLVMHGLDDPVVAASGGIAIAKAIPGARFIGFSGMGHDIPRELWPHFIREIAELCTETKSRLAEK